MTEWEDRSTNEDGDEEIEFRYLEPNVILADLYHFNGEDSFGRQEPPIWRVCLAKPGDDGELVTDTEECDGDRPEAEAKAWATAQIAKFLTR